MFPRTTNPSIRALLTAGIVCAFALAAASGPVFAVDATGIKAANIKDADLALMNNHDPASELENFELLDGFQVNLFAADPMLANPIHMHWDARGRLWVACSWTYPQVKPGVKPDDKIIILEDTDHDGVADKSTVFADGLYMPIGIELANGGVYVAQTPDVIFLRDLDGDDVADTREVALTGFGIEDSHHSISAWRRGPGGWIYFQEGIFLHTQVETQHGLVRNYNGGVYQYNPRTQELRVFAKIGVGNPWGHVFDEWGQSFFIDNPRVSYLTPATGNGGTKVEAPLLMKTEKQCGGDLVSGTHLPPELQGQLLTGRFKSRQVIRYEFTEDGSGYSANVLEPLIKSRHPNFRPVDTKIGPDGAVYVADWYNSIINHAQHDFRDPRRDHEHGRIWRITHKTRPLAEKPNLIGASLPDVVGELSSPNAWTRHQSRLVLSEKEDADDVAEALRVFVKNLEKSDPRHDHHLVEALWAFQNLDRVDEEILARVLDAQTGQARAAGARVIRYWHEELSDPVALIEKAAGDPFPRVRLEAILSAGFLHDARALPAALVALDYPRDRFIDTALPQTLRGLAPYWQPALEAGTLDFAKSAHRDFAMREAGLGFEKRLADFLVHHSPSRDEIRAVAGEFVSAADAMNVRVVVDTLASRRKKVSPAITVAMLDALQPIGRGGDVVIGRRIEPLTRLLDNPDEAIAASAAGAAGAWKIPGAIPRLTALLEDESRSTELRRASAIALGEIGRAESVEPLRALAGPANPAAARYLAVQGLAVADLAEAAAAAAELLAVDPGEGDPITLVTFFAGRSGGADALARALEGTAIHDSVTATVSERIRHTGQLPAALARIFQPASASSLSTALLAEKRSALTADVDRLGDPVRGEMIYRRKEIACMSCHAIAGAGPAIGPDLVAVGAAATTDYIVESILEPNKSLAEHYETVAITTTDNGFRMGVIAFKSEEKIVLRDAMQPGVEIEIPAKNVKKIKPMPSLMPPALADQLESRQEFLDLAHFVSRLGRPGNYAPSVAPVIRTWRVLARADPATEANPSAIPADALWLPAYGMVNGTLPAADLAGAPSVFARGFVNVQKSGAVALDIDHTKGLRLWIDGKEIEDLSGAFELTQGRRVFTFLIDRDTRGETGLRVELKTPPASNIKYQVEGGP